MSIVANKCYLPPTQGISIHCILNTLQKVAAAGNDAAAEETATWCAKRLPAPLVVVLNRCSQESIMPPLKLQTFCQV